MKDDADFDAERALRYELWINHLCPFIHRYGDDGEMQCQCRVDFKRDPIAEIHQIVKLQRLTHARQELAKAEQ